MSLLCPETIPEKLEKIFKILQDRNGVSKEAKAILAASAPKEPADWFEPKIQPFDSWKYQHPQSGEHQEVRQRWYREYRQKEKLLQWPNAYAEEVLKRID